MGDPVTNIANWLENLLLSLGLQSGFVTLLLAIVGVVVLATVVLVIDIILVWVERKVVARFQDRLPPWVHLLCVLGYDSGRRGVHRMGVLPQRRVY